MLQWNSVALNLT